MTIYTLSLDQRYLDQSKPVYFKAKFNPALNFKTRELILPLDLSSDGPSRDLRQYIETLFPDEFKPILQTKCIRHDLCIQKYFDSSGENIEEKDYHFRTEVYCAGYSIDENIKTNDLNQGGFNENEMEKQAYRSIEIEHRLIVMRPEIFDEILNFLQRNTVINPNHDKALILKIEDNSTREASLKEQIHKFKREAYLVETDKSDDSKFFSHTFRAEQFVTLDLSMQDQFIKNK